MKARVESSWDSTNGNSQGTRVKIERGERRRTRIRNIGFMGRRRKGLKWIVNGLSLNEFIQNSFILTVLFRTYLG
ncbi:hypothetical protein EUGRSUZ_E01490 [Eucalyptus grandis]|uniref:Uncharacterized protein n=2 Tax=Eucalyptus grandis TaxID=71139 RepID=A0ACC3KUK5_EUCGR|nr:hypothetical protein EUGRSUZ_E01490 [Eucalyptus grandis]